MSLLSLNNILTLRAQARETTVDVLEEMLDKLRIVVQEKLQPKRITSSPVAYADIAIICELDEQ